MGAAASEPEAEAAASCSDGGSRVSGLARLSGTSSSVPSNKTVVELVGGALSAIEALRAALGPGLGGEWVVVSTSAAQHFGMLLKLDLSEGVD